MTDRCMNAASRPRTYSSEETGCQPNDEQLETQQVNREQEAEREAEARRNAYYASGGDEGGRCARASSDASRYSPMLPDNPQLKDSRRSAASDPPLKDDPYGNAIVSAVAGGIAGGVRRAAVEALATPGRSVLEHMAIETGKGMAKGAAKTAITSTMRPAADVDPTPPAHAKDVPPTPPATPPPAGRTGSAGTSEVVNEPNQSCAPVYAPLVIVG